MKDGDWIQQQVNRINRDNADRGSGVTECGTCTLGTPVEVLLQLAHGAQQRTSKGSSHTHTLGDVAHIMAPANNTAGSAAMMLEEPLIRVSQPASKKRPNSRGDVY